MFGELSPNQTADFLQPGHVAVRVAAIDLAFALQPDQTADIRGACGRHVACRIAGRNVEVAEMPPTRPPTIEPHRWC
jgi:hypothetical protein